MNQLMDFAGGQSMPIGSTTASGASEGNKAIAEIQSAMAIAKRFPRDEIRAIDKIKNAFQRTGLAELSQYRYSKGGSDVSGPSIRSAETIAQLWGNFQFGFRELSRGTDENGVRFSEVEAYAWDIENNTKRPVTFLVRHWRDTKQGGYPLKDEREIYELTANMAQRRVRACIMAVIPGDVFDAAMDQATKTLKASADLSPEGIKKLLGAFAEFGVSKAQIEQRIQRKIDAIQPGQVVSLKQVYASLRDGMSVPTDWFDGADSSSSTEAAATELPDYPDREFKARFPNWQESVLAGETKPERIINMIATKYKLSDKQLDMIRGMAPAIDKPQQSTDDFLSEYGE